MFTGLWITSPAFGWGDLGHRIVAEYGTALADPQAVARCHTSVADMVAHTNDPDKIWRNQKFKFPHEAEMHFFHVDRQPRDWRVRNEAADTKQGRLVYHILDWAADAKKALKDKNWDGLAERLHGISHYLGDLSQPLHTNHDYDGDEAGLPDIHAQFETKMLNRFEADVRAGVKKRLAAERLPELWDQFDLRHLVFDTAEQSCVKVPKLFAEARHALVMPKRSKHHKYKTEPQPRFEKKILWERTGALAMDQLALGARLWAFALNSICRP